ncbi:DUF4349 domain-containing protein [Streptomyces sp. NPDC048603]|uniref:DUF4349 domain-containing protein n=1 Tax=Streptomyces sp. NPDC048603 TaxID=3365577 RepID=UPI00371ACAF3
MVALAALTAVGALALTGCAAGDESAASKPDRGFAAQREAAGAPAPASDAKAGGGAAAPQSAPGSPGSPAQVRQHIIRTAALGIEAKDPQKTLAAARTAVQGAGGYVGNETTQRSGHGDAEREGGGEGVMTSTVTLRVPVDRFDSVLAALEGSGKLLHRKVEAQDVTERVVDVESRVKSQQASVARVREMMEKATAIGDLVTLEGELNKRQTELEALLAQQNSLKDQTSLGTITLEVTAADTDGKEGKDGKDTDGPAFLDALEGGWGVFLAVLKWITLAVGALLPFALAGGVLLALWRVYRRFRPARDRSGARAGWPAGGLVPHPATPAAAAERSAAPAPAAQPAAASDPAPATPSATPPADTE